MTDDEKAIMLDRLKASPTAALVGIHHELKTLAKAITDAAAAKMEPVAARQELVALAMLHQLNAAGAQNIKTPAGTVYLYTQKHLSIVDGDALWTWARNNDAGDVYQRRVNISAVEGHNESNPDNPVAGLHAESIISARVRASK